MDMNQEQRRTNGNYWFLVCSGNTWLSQGGYAKAGLGRAKAQQGEQERLGVSLEAGGSPGEAGGSWLEGGIPEDCFGEHIWLSLVGPELEKIWGNKSREVSGHCPSPKRSGPLVQRTCLPSWLVTWVVVLLVCVAWPGSSAHSISYFVLGNISSKVRTEYMSVRNFKLRRTMGYLLNLLFNLFIVKFSLFEGCRVSGLPPQSRYRTSPPEGQLLPSPLIPSNHGLVSWPYSFAFSRMPCKWIHTEWSCWIGLLSRNTMHRHVLTVVCMSIARTFLLKTRHQSLFVFCHFFSSGLFPGLGSTQDIMLHFILVSP